MRQTNKNNSPVAVASDLTHQRYIAQKKMYAKIKKANQRTVWLAGLALSLAPLILALVKMGAHLEDDETVAICKKYIYDFMSSGSFLWIAITLLATSLLELLLHGFTDKIPKNDKPMYKKFVILSIVLLFLALLLFYDNIADPVNFIWMCVFSVVAFILFAGCSRIVTYKLVKEE